MPDITATVTYAVTPTAKGHTSDQDSWENAARAQKGAVETINTNVTTDAPIVNSTGPRLRSLLRRWPGAVDRVISCWIPESAAVSRNVNDQKMAKTE